MASYIQTPLHVSQEKRGTFWNTYAASGVCSSDLEIFL